MASQDQAQVFSGHTAKILIGDKEIGFFFEVSYSVDYGLQDVPVLGQTTVVEHQQTRYIVSGEARRYQIRDEIINPASGLTPANAAEALRKGVFNLDIIDKISGKIAIRLVDVTLGGVSEGISSGQLVSQRISFRGINTTMAQSNG
jgi:hypothetical protein